MLYDGSFSSSHTTSKCRIARPSSAARNEKALRHGLGKCADRKLERGTQTFAANDALSSVIEVAQGATINAAAALRSLWDSRDSIALQFPEVPSFASSWFPQEDGASLELKSRSPLEAAQRKQSVEEKEAEALRNVQEQASSNKAVQLLRARAEEGSAPGRRSDGAKLGLVVEGGGMRGAVSGGALQAIHDLGFRDCFDAVYGSSAGAINATYFLSGQREGVDIYSQDITNTNFIDLKRLLKRQDSDDYRPALDLVYLLDYVMNEVKPLDWQAVVESPVPLKVVASCLDSLQPVLLTNFADVDDLRECLRASATVPEVAGPPISHRGRRLVDAAVFEAIPFRAAIADGCTHILALPTRPPYKRGDLLGKLVDDSVAAIVKRAVLSPAYMCKAWAREVEYQRAFGCSPEELLARYSPLCIDAATIMLGIADGRAAVERILGSPVAQPAALLPAKTAKEAAQKSSPVIATTRLL